MIGHLLVDVEIGGRRRIKTGQQFVHHNQQPHLARLFDKALLDLLLKFLDQRGRVLFAFIEILRQHLAIDLVLGKRLGLPRAGLFPLDHAGIRLIAGHNGALATKAMGAEHLVAFASLIDTRADQHGIATAIGQPGFLIEIEQNIPHDLLQPRATRQQLLHRGPLLLELLASEARQRLGFGLKPLVHLLLGFDLLIDVTRLIAQIQHHAIRDGLIKLVGVDVGAKHLHRLLLVPFHQRRAGKTDK